MCSPYIKRHIIDSNENDAVERDDELLHDLRHTEKMFGPEHKADGNWCGHHQRLLAKILLNYRSWTINSILFRIFML